MLPSSALTAPALASIMNRTRVVDRADLIFHARRLHRPRAEWCSATLPFQSVRVFSGGMN
jgi:hypothetical protein